MNLRASRKDKHCLDVSELRNIRKVFFPPTLRWYNVRCHGENDYNDIVDKKTKEAGCGTCGRTAHPSILDALFDACPPFQDH